MITNKIIKVLKVQADNYQVVLNVGSEDGIANNQRFLIYTLGEEFIDPDTNENLGRLEIVKGTGIVTHLQEKMCTVQSDKRTRTVSKKVIKQESPYIALNFGNKTITESIPTEHEMPFDNPEEGDYAKVIESYLKH